MSFVIFKVFLQGPFPEGLIVLIGSDIQVSDVIEVPLHEPVQDIILVFLEPVHLFLRLADETEMGPVNNVFRLNFNHAATPTLVVTLAWGNCLA